MQAKLSWVALAVGLVALAIPGPASAATTVGATFIPSPTLCATTSLQTTSPNGHYTVPFSGVLTSWSHRASGAPPLVNFKVARSAGGNNFTIIGDSGLTSQGPSVLNTHPTRIPVRAGDVIGAYANGAGICNLASGYEAHTASGDRQVGDTTTYSLFPGDVQIDVSAALEPDADNDGFGDETQDNCPGTGNPGQEDVDADGIGDPCDDHALPDATITKGPKDKTKNKTATFEFTGTDARAIAGFQCKLDAGAFVACTSPHTVKVKKGKHTFQVQAIDQAGNLGAPATDSWKVKKKKKK